MSQASNTIDLERLALSPGQGHRMEVEVAPGQIELGGQAYAFTADSVPARLDLSRTTSGYAMRLAFGGELTGPCMRCLADAQSRVEVEAREVDQPGSGDEELASPYVTDAVLDVERWAHDALALALPATVLCRPDCAGLCPVCGESLNDVEPGSHEHEKEPDPRWAKLRELLD